MVDKIEAVKLRKQGLSYSKIAKQLGCSEAWCKKNLKGVERGVNDSPANTEVKLKAIAILQEALKKLREI